MQVLDNVVVDNRAFTTFHTLPVLEQGRILEALAGLTARPPEQWPADDVARLDTPDPLYLLRAGDLRVIFRREGGGRITILDVVRKETLERYFSQKP